LCEKKDYTLEDPVVPGLTYHYGPQSYPMDYKFKRVFKQYFGKVKPEKVIEAIQKWGIALTQFEIKKQKFLMGTHTIPIIGWGEVNGKVVFLCHDSFGDYDVTHTQDEKGAPRYRYITADMLDELIVFPHRLDIKATKIDNQTYQITVKDSAGNLRDARIRAFITKKSFLPKKIKSLLHKIYKKSSKPDLEIPVFKVGKGTYKVILVGNYTGKNLKIVAEKKYFYKPDGEPHSIEFEIK
jgi:hypothetical protein